MIDDPLSFEEFDRLSQFLEDLGPPAMNFEALDGYFAALVCSPEVILPSEYLPEVWGQDLAFETNVHASDILGLIMRHWNTVAWALPSSLAQPAGYVPLLLEGEDGVVRGNDWARGFMRGVQARPAPWRKLVESDEPGGLLLPILLLAHEGDPDPAKRPKPIKPEQRSHLLQLMTASLAHIYRYFEPHRQSSGFYTASPPRRRSTGKVGRNESCLCGSGKKYKQCCGGASSLH